MGYYHHGIDAFTGDVTRAYRRTRTADPASEPVTTSEAITHLRWTANTSVTTDEVTSSTDFANTTDPLTVTGAVTTYTGIDFVAGKLFKIESEILEVDSVSGNDVTFLRGRLDTTIKSHAAGKGISKGDAQTEQIADLIVMAREYAEEYTESSLITQTWKVVFDNLPAVIVLPRPPLVSVSSITYSDENGSTQTITASDYTVDTVTKPGRVIAAYEETWPTVRNHIGDVAITFVAGYGSRSSVPRKIKQAIKLLVEKQFFGGCEDMKENMTANRLLDFHSYRVPV